MKDFLKKIEIEYWVAIAVGGVVTAINVFGYGNEFGIRQSMAALGRYFAFDDPHYALFLIAIYGLFLWKFYGELTDIADRVLLKKLPFQRESLRRLGTYLVQPFLVFLPLALATIPFSPLLWNISYASRGYLKDEIFFAADLMMTGTAPFLSLPGTIQMALFADVTRYAYYGMVVASNILMVLLFAHPPFRRLFRHAVLAFIFSLAIAFPFFALLPAEGPAAYFIMNVRERELSPLAKDWLNPYDSLPIVDQTVRKIHDASLEVDFDNTLPVSSFPSMHATWGLFVVYFLFKIKKWSLALSLPWFVLQLTGGIYYAQHYVVDYVAALPVAAISLGLAYGVLELERKFKNSP